MGLYIKGVEMPQDGRELIIRVFQDGTVYDLHGIQLPANAIPVSDHGRLIDADAMIEDCHVHNSQRTLWGELEYLIDNTPTIIPADEEENE